MSVNGQSGVNAGTRYAWKLRDIVVTGILCVVGGAFFMGVDWLYNLLFPATASPVFSNSINGLWWIPAVLVPYIIRRPGAAFIAEVVAALFEFAFGSPYSAGAVISGIVQGLGAEIVFALFGWKVYRTAVLMFAGTLAGAGYAVQAWFQYGWSGYVFGVALGAFVVTLLSGALFGGLLAKWIGDALNRTGVLRNFEIGKQARG